MLLGNMSNMVDQTRIRTLTEGIYIQGPIVYWMQRDMRAHHNWALLRAQEIANEQRVPLIVVFNRVRSFLHAQPRHFTFMLEGLAEVKSTLASLNIPLCLLEGDPEVAIPSFIHRIGAGVLVTDFSPLRTPRKWKDGVAKAIDVRFEEVDAHNIIPCWIASDKEEFAAHTFRTKVRARYRTYAGSVPKTKKHGYTYTEDLPMFSYEPTHENTLSWIPPGSKAARIRLQRFIEQKLDGYAIRRNDPTSDGQSDLSPYLHFGHISAQEVAFVIENSHAPTEDKRSFLEELIVRRELSDNFCFYQKDYDSFNGLRDWAKESLGSHSEDVREFIYSEEEFEEGRTHDALWNAAQMQMVKTGKMHGYMRMYWAKKILEWTASPQQAIDIAVKLNDTYSLDGRDPNGYAGVLWSIGGIHDRAWFERDVFGKIRYMNYNGCKRKFDVDAYIAKISQM